MSTTLDPTRILQQTTAADSQERQRVIDLANTPAARELRVKLAAAYRILARKGLDDGIAGHISLRIPGAPE